MNHSPRHDSLAYSTIILVFHIFLFLVFAGEDRIYRQCHTLDEYGDECKSIICTVGNISRGGDL